MGAFDKAVAQRIRGSVDRLRTQPAQAVAELLNDAQGISALIDLWDELGDAAATAGGWCKFATHHDRMFTLMGFDPNADLDDVGPIATLSFRLVITNTPSEGEHGDGPLSAEEERAVSNQLITLCEAKVDELNEALQTCADPNIARYQYSDEVCVDLSAGAMQLYRYETTLDRMLRTTISQLIQLEKTGADLAEDEPELEVVVEQTLAPNEATEVVIIEAPAPNEATEEVVRAELRDRGGRVWGLEDGSNPLIGEVEAEIDKV
jgi:hypothetical protein